MPERLLKKYRISTITPAATATTFIKETRFSHQGPDPKKVTEASLCRDSSCLECIFNISSRRCKGDWVDSLGDAWDRSRFPYTSLEELPICGVRGVLYPGYTRRPLLTFILLVCGGLSRRIASTVHIHSERSTAFVVIFCLYIVFTTQPLLSIWASNRFIRVDAVNIAVY